MLKLYRGDIMRIYKYKNIRFIIRLVEYNFDYYISKYQGVILIFINKNITKTMNSREVSRLIHKAIKETW